MTSARTALPGPSVPVRWGNREDDGSSAESCPRIDFFLYA